MREHRERCLKATGGIGMLLPLLPRGIFRVFTLDRRTSALGGPGGRTSAHAKTRLLTVQGKTLSGIPQSQQSSNTGKTW